jgi:hypothetical protein
MNSKESTIEIDNRLVNVVEIDWEKRNWTRIYTPDEERERAEKMLRLNGAPDYDPDLSRLLAASSTKKQPTFKVKRPGLGKLQGGSIIQRQLLEQDREKAEEGLRLNGI